MSNYITWSRACSLAGIVESDLNADEKEAIDDWVEEVGINLEFGCDSFSITSRIATVNSEIHNIDSDNQKALILDHSPVVSVERLRDNIRTTTPTELIEDDQFIIDKKAGIIKLIDFWETGNSQSLSSMQNCFTKGAGMVDVAYTYGYAAVPNDIKAYATMLAAKAILVMKSFAGSVGFASFKMGDYTENLGSLYKQNADFLDSSIETAKMKLRTKYGNMVDESLNQ